MTTLAPEQVDPRPAFDGRTEAKLLEQLAERLRRARPMLIVSPPRSASTAFARALGQHTATGRYFHEPCGLYSYEKTSLATVLDALDGLAPGAYIKEMTFQFEKPEVAECFFRNCKAPTIFLARSPLLTLESRIRMVLTDLIQDPSTPERDREAARTAIATKEYAAVAGLLTEEVFPLFRTGWTDFADQLETCRSLDLGYAIVETTRFRAEPESILTPLLERFGLDFEPGMLRWPRRDSLPPGALERHSIWYARVDKSTGILPPTEEPVPPERFPARFREHLDRALETYARALSDPNCL